MKNMIFTNLWLYMSIFTLFVNYGLSAMQDNEPSYFIPLSRSLNISSISAPLKECSFFSRWKRLIARMLSDTGNSVGELGGKAIVRAGTILVENINEGLRPGQEGQEGQIALIFGNVFHILADQWRENGQAKEALLEFVRVIRNLWEDEGEGRQAIQAFFQMLQDQVRQGGQVQQALNQAVHMLRNQFEEGGEARAGLRALEAAVEHDLKKGIEGVGGELALQVDQVGEAAYSKFKKGAITTTALTITAITAWYGSKVLWNSIERKITKPRLIITSSKKSLWQKLKNIVIGSKPYDQPMIFSQDLQNKLENIVATTRYINENIKKGKKNLKYRNLLLWGPPGTGKTMFAQKLAQASGMEFVTMSGSSFSKFKKGEGIIAVDELFSWANKSSKGLLIFIDEAEAFLGERKKVDISSESYQLLTNWLNYTGERSNKFMIVYATNYPNALDVAMGRRIDDSIQMPLPGKSERAAILRLYRDTLLFDRNLNNQAFIESVHKYVNEVKLEEIALETDGLSCGELNGIINTLKSDAEVTPEGIITEELIDKIVKQAIDKNQQFAQHFSRFKQFTY